MTHNLPSLPCLTPILDRYRFTVGATLGIFKWAATVLTILHGAKDSLAGLKDSINLQVVQLVSSGKMPKNMICLSVL